MHGDSAIVNEHSPFLASHKEYVLEKKRWYIVTLFALQSMVNNLIWITFGPITPEAQTYFNQTPLKINLFSIAFMVTGLCLTLVGSWVIDRIGLRFGVNLSAFFNLIGAWIRASEYFMGREIAYWVVLFGSFITALGQPVFTVAPTKVAASWFGEKERTIATSIASLSSLLGMAVAFQLGPNIVKEPKDFPKLFLVQAVIATVASVLCFISFRGQPATPPSSSQEWEKGSFVDALSRVFKQRNFFALILSFGIGFGFFVTLFTVMSQVVQPLKYSQGEAGTIGVVMILSGIVGGGLVFGPIIDKWRKYKITMIISNLGTGISIGAFYITLFTDWFPHHIMIVMVTAGFVGFFAISMLPVGMETAVEICYPMAEATITGILLLSGNIFSIIIVVIAGFLQAPHDGSMIHAMQFMIGCLALSAIILFALTGPYKRLEYEQTRHQKLTAN